uniref:6-cysteine protein n=1 Tax=Strongyloides papillosus TaxID=174720 RepID=A0A0N5B2R8_STREA
MTQLFYINLKFIISTCVLFELITTEKVFKAEDLELEYYLNQNGDETYLGSLKGEVREHVKFKFYGRDVTKSLILYKIHIPRKFSDDGHYDNKFIAIIKNIHKDKTVNSYFFKPELEFYSFTKTGYKGRGITCKLFKCNIGIVYYCPHGYRNCEDTNEIKNFFYIALTKSHDYDNLVLKVIPKYKNTNIFSVMVCPGSTWLTQTSNAEFIETEDNALTRFTSQKSSKNFTLKYTYCHDIGNKSFVKCGYVKQMFMPSIDVGYECYEYNQERAPYLINGHIEEINMVTSSSGELTCYGAIIDRPSSPVIAFLPPENNNINTFKISRFTRNTKLYPGYKLHYVKINDFSPNYLKSDNHLGKSFNYEAKCIIPPLNATLRLKINGFIQEFENKVDGNFGKIDIYTFDRKEIEDTLIGCHAVPDEMKHPAFSDFYALLHPTSLLMFDETTRKHIEVISTKQLVPNKKYKCILKYGNSKNKKPNYIKETEFVINFTGEYLYWIIFGVFILVTSLLIVGLVIYKKIQSKKKKQNNSSSTSSSMSSSQSTTKSSTVISEVSNVPIIQNKNVAAKSTNMGKTMVNKNANINNKVTNLEQKVATKNSNLNLANQAKNAPKKVVGKNSNQKKISNMEDSVFKVK